MKTLPNKNGEQIRMTKTWLMYLQLFVPYVVTFAIWGVIFSIVELALVIGVIVGLVISLFSSLAISKAQTVEKQSEMIFASGALWGPPPILLGIIGLAVLVAKLIFKF